MGRKMYTKIMDDHFPEEMTVSFGGQTLVYRKRTWKITDPESRETVEKGLRYGENPGQEAALYELVNGNLTLGECQFIDPGRGLVSALTEDDLLQFGKHPGKINLTDVDNALNILKFFPDTPAAAVMKHNNPSGVARAGTIEHAFAWAFMADRIAAFGGCAALNRPCDRATAEAMNEQYLEVVVAPEFETGTLDILQQRKNLRVIRIKNIEKLHEYRQRRFLDFKSLIDGGIVVQQSPLNRIDTAGDLTPASRTRKGTTTVIERAPTEAELSDMLFGWAVEMGVTSNSVLFVKDGRTVAIGTGEQDRVGVVRSAITKAYVTARDRRCFDLTGKPYWEYEAQVKQGEADRAPLDEIERAVAADHAGLSGAVMVSDAFFPFRDGVDLAIAEGIGAIVQPGGSLNDDQAIRACNEADPQVAMMFTGQRSFKH